MRSLRACRVIASLSIGHCTAVMASQAAGGSDITSSERPTEAATAPAATEEGPTVVRLIKTDTGFELLRNGEPFFIRGAGGRGHLDLLAAAGANSLRTWHARNVGSVLDEAHKVGLSVCAGLWLGHENLGVDYSNPEHVARMREEARAAVLAHKDHPAVLLWGVGNEMEGDGSNPHIWRAVNDIARMIKEIDPNHPTMTVIAGTGKDKIRQLNRYCPDIDIVGINAYGDLNRIPPALEAQGLTRPFIITEFGPKGWWQVPKTSWGAELEPTSTEKAETYRESYEAAVSSQTGKCLGSYAFLWGTKQEHTHTWFGMLLESGERTAAVDTMTKLWTGNWPANRCPAVHDIKLAPLAGDEDARANGEHIYPPGAKLSCSVDADDPDGDEMNVSWELRRESTDKRTGGYSEHAPAALPSTIIAANAKSATLQLPTEAAAYRLFVTVKDGNGNAATANVPILVRRIAESETAPPLPPAP